MMKEKRVVAFGFFDGVHRGHAELIKKTKEVSEKIGAVPTVLSFDIHPDNLVRNIKVPLINSAEDRVDIIERVFGINSVIFMHFNREIMQIPWREFIVSLSADLNVAHYVVGHDFRFGWKGEGNAEKLCEYCAENGLGCNVIPQVLLEGEVISSTRIRELLMIGDIPQANRMLGHPYSFSETVRYGFQLGKKMGTPTINMQFAEDVLVPKHGVYITKVFTEDGSAYPAVTNIGVRPTVSSEHRVSVESYLVNFEGNLYERKVRIEFYKYLRGEKKFNDTEQLRAQIISDAEEAKNFF